MSVKITLTDLNFYKKPKMAYFALSEYVIQFVLLLNSVKTVQNVEIMI